MIVKPMPKGIHTKTIFKQIFAGHNNLMTPEIIEYGQKNNNLWELSRGDFMHKELWGITVIEWDGQEFKHSHSKSQSFSTKSEAIEYTQQLRNR